MTTFTSGNQPLWSDQSLRSNFTSKWYETSRPLRRGHPGRRESLEDCMGRMQDDRRSWRWWRTRFYPWRSFWDQDHGGKVQKDEGCNQREDVIDDWKTDYICLQLPRSKKMEHMNWSNGLALKIINAGQIYEEVRNSITQSMDQSNSREWLAWNWTCLCSSTARMKVL